MRITVALWVLNGVLLAGLIWLFAASHESDVAMLAITFGPPVAGAVFGPVFADASPGRRLRASGCGMLIGFAGVALSYLAVAWVVGGLLTQTGPSLPVPSAP